MMKSSIGPIWLVCLAYGLLVMALGTDPLSGIQTVMLGSAGHPLTPGQIATIMGIAVGAIGMAVFLLARHRYAGHDDEDEDI